MRDHILVVGRDVELRGRLARLLKGAGYRVELAESVAHARRLQLKTYTLALVAADGLGPDVTTLLSALEDKGVKPLLIAGHAEEPGADVVDHCDEAALLARIAEALRPVSEGEVPALMLRFRQYSLDLGGHSLTDETGRDIPLTRGEFNLLREFLQRPGRVLSRDQLLNALAGRDAEAFDRSIDMLVMRLRRKIEPDPKHPSVIITIPGVGYKFVGSVSKVAATAPPGALRTEPDRRPPPGSPLANPERRQLTILHCLLSGPALAAAQREPEELHHLLASFHERCVQVVSQVGGTVARLLNDGAVAYFGYPQADEHQAGRAIYAGLDLIEANRRISTSDSDRLFVHTGIASGLVVVSRLGNSAEPAALGEPATRAAALATHAAPDTALISGRTRALVGDLFQYRPHAPITLDGAAESFEAWTVAGTAHVESRFDLIHSEQLSGFVGRGAELRLLLDRWHLARGGEGQVMLLGGEPGIGKSRVLQESRARLHGEKVAIMRVQCSPYHVSSAFYPIIASFERALKFNRGDTPGEKLDKLEALLVATYGLPRADVRLIASLLSIPCETRYGSPTMTPQRLKHETLRALVETVVAASRRRPTVVFIEDVLWADPSTLEAIDLLIRRVAHLRLMIIITHRPEFRSRWSGYENVTAITLTRLTRAQSAEMVFKLTKGKALPPDLLEQILFKTDGVPLFVEELTKSVLESPELQDAGDHYVRSSSLSLTIPSTLRHSLMARLDRVASVKAVAQIGSVIGREFSYELISAVWSQTKPELEEALSQLTASGLAFCQGTPPDAVYTFKHALVRDAAYDSLLKGQRQVLHGKIGHIVENRFPATAEPELLAYHHTEAKHFQKAIALWHKAGALALKRMSLNEALRHLERGLDLIATLPASVDRDQQELDLRCALGTAWMALKGWAAEEVSIALSPALDLALSLRRTDALLPILRGLWGNVLSRGRIREALGWVKRMLDAAKAYCDPALMLFGHKAAGTSYYFLGDLIRAKKHQDTVLSLYDEQAHGELTTVLNMDPKTWSLGFKAQVTWMLGYPDQARAIRDEAELRARQRRHPFDLGWVLTSGSITLHFLREPEEQLKRAHEGEQIGRENSMPFVWGVLAPINSGIALILQGKAAEGVPTLKSALTTYEQTGGEPSLYYLSALACGLVQLNDLDGALRLIDEMIERVERPGWEERYCFAEILRIKGQILSLHGDVPGAERSYRASLDCARRQEAKSWELRTAVSYALLLRDQARSKEAYELLAPIYAWFTEGFGTKDLKDAKALVEQIAIYRRSDRQRATLQRQ